MRFLALAVTLLPCLVRSAPLEVKRAGESLPPPSQDPFYKVPLTIGLYGKGQIVDKRGEFEPLRRLSISRGAAFWTFIPSASDVTTNIEGSNVASSYQVSTGEKGIRKWTQCERRRCSGFLSSLHRSYPLSLALDSVTIWADMQCILISQTFIGLLQITYHWATSWHDRWWVRLPTCSREEALMLTFTSPFRSISLSKLPFGRPRIRFPLPKSSVTKLTSRFERLFFANRSFPPP